MTSAIAIQLYYFKARTINYNTTRAAFMSYQEIQQWYVIHGLTFLKLLILWQEKDASFSLISSTH